MATCLRGLLRGSVPIVLATALVAVLGLGGSAYAAKLITGSNIKDGSITAADLSKKVRASLHGVAGAKGDRGRRGSLGLTGAAGSNGAAGQAGTNGAPGAAGVNGAAGSDGQDAVRYFAAVSVDGGTVTRAHSVTGVTKTQTGVYHVALTGLPDVSSCIAIAQVSTAGISDVGGAFAVSLADGHVTVNTFAISHNSDPVGSALDRAFVVTVSC